MRELASMSGVSASLISKIETGKVSPTVMSLQKLLEAVNVDLFEFFLEHPAANLADRVVFKRSEMPVANDVEHTWFYAFPKHSEMKGELTYEEYLPHTHRVEKESHRGDVMGCVIEGELTLEFPGRGIFVAEAGDAFYIKAREPHTARNSGDVVLKLVAVQLRD